jgi:hypothetical protein
MPPRTAASILLHMKPKLVVDIEIDPRATGDGSKPGTECEPA